MIFMKKSGLQILAFLIWTFSIRSSDFFFFLKVASLKDSKLQGPISYNRFFIASNATGNQLRITRLEKIFFDPSKFQKHLCF